MAFINKMGISKKLSFSFGVLLLFLAGLGALGVIALGRVTTTYRHVVEVNLPKEKLLSEFRMAQKDIVVAVRTATGADADDTVLDQQAKAIQEANNNFEKAAKEFDDLYSTDTEKTQWAQAKEGWKPLLELSSRIVELSRSKNPADVAQAKSLAKKDFDLRRKNIRTPIEALRDFQLTDSNNWSTSADKTANDAKWTMIVSELIGLFLGLSGAAYLTINIKNLLTMITRRLATGAGEVGGAAKQISASSEELSSSVTEQAAALQETSASIEEISSMISKTAENADNSRKISDASYETVQDGQKLIERLIGAIQEINGSNTQISAEIEESNRQITEIAKVISAIGTKTQVINDIVFQTKLLSFNASVEAARAGEHGKGFAVVAEEVGNLAQMSGNAALEISGMLRESITKVEGTVQSISSRVGVLIQAGHEKVGAGMEIAQQCDQTFRQIVTKTNEVRTLVEAITAATREQSSGVSEVSKAIGQLNEATQRNNTVSQNGEAAASQLSGQAAELSAVVSQLVNAVEGERSNGGSGSPTNTGSGGRSETTPATLDGEKDIDLSIAA